MGQGAGVEDGAQEVTCMHPSEQQRGARECGEGAFWVRKWLFSLLFCLCAARARIPLHQGTMSEHQFKSCFDALRPNQTILARRDEMKPSTGEGVWVVLEELRLRDPPQVPETPPKGQHSG